MKVVCDNCRAVYKVPDDKLTKAVNKATCRNCGHRMLIPRPKPNADPEERTLVTAVPPTPAGAPPRSGQDQPVQRSSGPDDLNMGTPMVAPRVDQTIPGHEEEFDEAPDTKLSVSNSERPSDPRMHRSHPAPSEQVTAKDRQGQRNPPSMPPDRAAQNRSIPPKRASQTGSNPMSAPIETPPPMQPPAPISAGSSAGRRPQSTPPRGTPASPPRSAPPPGPRTGAYPAAMALYDPAGDLNWALLGTSTALIGGFLLAFLSVWNHPLVMWFGLAMTFGGGLLTFMVLLTGGRGRRPAKTLLSLVLGFMVAIVMSSTMVATKWGAERVIDAYDIHFSNVGLTGGTSTPTVAVAAPSLGSVAPPTETTAPPGGGLEPRAPVAAPVAPRSDGVAMADPSRAVAPPVAPPAVPKGVKAPPVAAPIPAPPPPPKPAPNTTTTRPPPAMPAPVPAPAPPPPPAPAAASGSEMTTVPMNVIHVMLSNNLEVKKCFVPLFKAGALPPRVDLKFNIMPSGAANSAQILQSNFRGSELEGCLSRAIGGITFPPTTGPGTSITYPFVLQ